jgi:hypothetical protein
MYTTVEGLMDTMRDRIIKANPLQHAVGDSASMADAPRRFREFLEQFEQACRGELAVTIILKDPMANSWVYSPWDDMEDGSELAATAGFRGAHLTREAKVADDAATAAAESAAGGSGTSEATVAAASAAADAGASSALHNCAAATGRDPRLTVRWYTRTEEEDIDLGIADMDVDAFPSASADAGTAEVIAATADDDAGVAAAAAAPDGDASGSA